MTIEALRGPATLRQAVVAQLREAIVSGAMAPGQQIKESELSVQLGLSVTPLREALVELAVEGLVEIQPHRFKRVAPMDLQAMVKLLEVQIELWALGYAWGAPKVGPREVAALRQVHGRHARALSGGDRAGAVVAALDFHLVLMEATRNRELARVSTDRLALIRRFILQCTPWLVSREALAQHQAMLDALERGQVDETLALLREASDSLLGSARKLRDASFAVPDTP